MGQHSCLAILILAQARCFLEVGDKCRRGLGVCPDNSFSTQSPRLLLILMPKDKTRPDPT